MKSILKAVLVSLVLLLIFSSCATITEEPEGARFSLGRKEPSTRDEMRLLSLEVPQSGNLSANVEYWTTIHFEANSKPEIGRACFSFSGDDQSCVDVLAKDVNFGSRAYFRVLIHIPAGTKRIDCHAEYLRGGKVHQTNTVTYYVVVVKKPEE